jgi:hypothetical protein
VKYFNIILIITVLFLTNNLNANNKKLESKINNLKEKRLSRITLLNKINPFAGQKPKQKVISIVQKKIKPKKTTKKKQKKVFSSKLELISVFNHKVNINHKWYSIGDYIGNFKISEILQDMVVLRNSNSKKILTIHDNYDNEFSDINILVISKIDKSPK